MDSPSHGAPLPLVSPSTYHIVADRASEIHSSVDKGLAGQGPVPADSDPTRSATPSPTQARSSPPGAPSSPRPPGSSRSGCWPRTPQPPGPELAATLDQISAARLD